jgi:ATP-dependent RNA helicase RhlE
MPPEIRTLANALLQNPHVVELAHSRPASTIEHALYSVPAHQKFDVLRYILREDGFTSGIVFLRTKHRAKRLARDLVQAGHSAVALEGNMTQSQRDRAMSGFREGRFDLLVATDIAARGLDVAELSHVINFDVPGTPDAYTHRIGRTGRAERSGKAYTLFCAQELPEISAIERRLGGRIKRLDTPSLDGLPPIAVASSSLAQRDSVQPPHGGRGGGNNGARSRGRSYGATPTGRNAGYSGRRRGNGRSANSSRKP